MLSHAESKKESTVDPAVSEGRAGLREYIAIARPDHWTKNLFILPGLFLGKLVSGAAIHELILPLLIGMAATCLISSANYTLNEWLDREFDRFHPRKRSRPSVSGSVRASGVYLQYALLAIAGLGVSALIHVNFVFASASLLVMGLLYNVRPFRTKDRAYLDVVSESINNPIRLCMGWLITVPNAFPPSTILLGYWFGGAFLMAVKRFAEFRTIGDSRTAGLYRRSFQTYTSETLLASAIFHAMAASLFLGVFLVKYRIELILSFPFVAGLFTWYLRMGMKENSAAQHPEKLLSEGRFMIYVVGLTILMGSLFVVDIPILHKLLRVTFPEL